jgi:hypothetical protein
MSLTSLYRIYKVALWASKAIAEKQFALERELRFR